MSGVLLTLVYSKWGPCRKFKLGHVGMVACANLSLPTTGGKKVIYNREGPIQDYSQLLDDFLKVGVSLAKGEQPCPDKGSPELEYVNIKIKCKTKEAAIKILNILEQGNNVEWSNIKHCSSQVPVVMREVAGVLDDGNRCKHAILEAFPTSWVSDFFWTPKAVRDAFKKFKGKIEGNEPQNRGCFALFRWRRRADRPLLSSEQ